MATYAQKSLLMLCFLFLFVTQPTQEALANPISVNAHNFVEAQMYIEMEEQQQLAGGVNKWTHFREPTPISAQQIVRMNRDTLYSLAVINVSQGATITLPDTGKRYISLAIINSLGYTNHVFYGGGKYTLTPENVGSDYALAIVRIFADPYDSNDVATVNKLQDMYKIEAKNEAPMPVKSWNMEELKKYSQLFSELFGLAVAKSSGAMFGKEEEVDPIYFMIGATGGFGGLPQKEAMYFGGTPKEAAKAYSVTLKDVPVDGFWSITIYDKDGYLFESEYGRPSINNVTAKPNADNSYTIRIGMCEKDTENCLAIEDGWNYILRLYQPGEEILSGQWQLPKLQKVLP